MTFVAGVIAVQGDVAEHADAIRRAAPSTDEVDVRPVRTAGIVPSCDFLSIPGGESTTISRLIHREGLASEIFDHAAAGKPILATCAGLIVLSRDANDERIEPLGILDIAVQRNAFGRQKDSFEARVQVDGLDRPFPAVFIRAPIIEFVGDSARILSNWDDRIIAVREGSVVGTAFHPELTDDPRIHRLTLASEGPTMSPD